MADKATTTRRGLFGVAAGLATLIAVPALARQAHTGNVASEPLPLDTPQGFINSIALMNSRTGRQVAERAMAAGWLPEECTLIILHTFEGSRAEMPQIHFNRVGGGFAVFKPLAVS